MQKTNLSGPAVFMYSVITLTTIISAVCFVLHYSGTVKSGIVLWTGIVSFMILYHFGFRIYMGNVTKKWSITYKHPRFKQRSFEKQLYKTLKVRKWKDKVLTFEPDMYDFRNRTPHQLATTMAKSETDHWINEIISIISMFFSFIWGCPAAFIISALAAMVFDARFIVVQRYNRPIVLRLAERQSKEKATALSRK